MIDKHACSSQCPCQQGRDQAIVERVVGRVLDKPLVERVASRYMQAVEAAGKSQDAILKYLHSGHAVQLTDMARHPDFRGVHLKDIMSAAEALKKKGVIEYDGKTLTKKASTVVALDIGQGVFGDHLKIHHFSGSLKITDMDNAGKRGKKVRILSVLPAGSHSADDRQTSEELLKPLVDHILHMTYDQAKKAIEGINKENSDLNEDPFNISEHEVRGIDVEPKGTVIQLQKKFPNGTIVSIKASPHDFQVSNSVVIKGDPENPRPADGHRDDMGYWSRGRESGIVFYGWLKDNVSKAANMTMEELKKVWHELGVKFDSH